MAAARTGQGGLIAEQSGRYRLETPLTFQNVPALQSVLPLADAAGSGALTIDLSRVPRVDSAGLALLINWLAEARAHGRQLRYEAVSEPLRALARLSDVEALIVGEPC